MISKNFIIRGLQSRGGIYSYVGFFYLSTMQMTLLTSKWILEVLFLWSQFCMCGWARNGREAFPLLYHLGDGGNPGTGGHNSSQWLWLKNALSGGSSGVSCCFLPLKSVTLPLMNELSMNYRAGETKRAERGTSPCLHNRMHGCLRSCSLIKVGMWG